MSLGWPKHEAGDSLCSKFFCKHSRIVLPTIVAIFQHCSHLQSEVSHALCLNSVEGFGVSSTSSSTCSKPSNLPKTTASLKMEIDGHHT